MYSEPIYHQSINTVRYFLATASILYNIQYYCTIMYAVSCPFNDPSSQIHYSMNIHIQFQTLKIVI